jgi:integrase
VFYRDKNARQKRLTLGRYPPVKLVDARELARNAQRTVAHGGDPVTEKRTAREVLTFGKLAEKYIEEYAKLSKKSWEEDERQINADLLPKWKSRPATEVRSEDLLLLLNAKVKRGAPVAANRLRALVSRIFTFGAGQRFVPATANPVIGVKKPTKEASRERVLSDDEIRRIWDACDTQNPYVRAWFRLRLVTAQRGGELLQMRWRDIDEKSHFWSIPAEYVKNAQGHRVYLNALARKVIATVPRDDTSVWVFPKSFMGDYKHVGRRLARARARTSLSSPRRGPESARRLTFVAMTCGARQPA